LLIENTRADRSASVADLESVPFFAISVVSRMVHMHPQTIRNYERMGLIHPSRTGGNMRLFSKRDVQRLEQINNFTEMGINLAGVEVIVRLLEQMEQMRRQIDGEIDRARSEAEEEILRLRREFDRRRR
jgi:MerR family transcriptional regulator/heat shock protein HspR